MRPFNQMEIAVYTW